MSKKVLRKRITGQGGWRDQTLLDRPCHWHLLVHFVDDEGEVDGAINPLVTPVFGTLAEWKAKTNAMAFEQQDAMRILEKLCRKEGHPWRWKEEDTPVFGLERIDHIILVLWKCKTPLWAEEVEKAHCVFPPHRTEAIGNQYRGKPLVRSDTFYDAQAGLAQIKRREREMQEMREKTRTTPAM